MITAKTLSTLSKNEIISLICDYQEIVQKENNLSFDDFYHSSTLIFKEQFKNLEIGDVVFDGGHPTTILNKPYEDFENESCWKVETDNGVLYLGELYSNKLKYIIEPNVFATIRWCYEDLISVLVRKGIPEGIAVTKVHELSICSEAFKNIIVEQSWDILNDVIDLESVN